MASMGDEPKPLDMILGIGGHGVELIRAVGSGPVGSKKLGSILGVNPDVVQDLYGRLKEYGLVVTARGRGVELTPRGELLRRWLRKVDRVPFDEEGLLSAKIPIALTRIVGEKTDCIEAVIHSEVFGDFFRKLTAIIGMARVVADGTGWHAAIVDRDKNAVLSVHLPKANMRAYRPLSEPVEFVVSAEAAAAKRFNGLARAHLDPRRGLLELEAGRLNWSLRVYEKEFIPEVPNLTNLGRFRWPVEFQVDGDELARGLRALVPGHVRLIRLQVDNEAGGRFLMTDEAGERECTPAVEFASHPLGVYKFRSAFRVDYLDRFFKVFRGDRLVVHLDTNMPLRVDWSGPYTRGTWFLAPVIEPKA